MSNKVINLKQKAQLIQDHWSPRVIASVDDSYVKLAKVKGQFTWHDHQEDEFFMVLEGQLTIQIMNGTETEEVVLNPGEIYVVPKGVMHNPVAESECTLMLFEKKSTAHTGEVEADLTKGIEDQLKPL
jgi:mannose-6-phosphate isomerase-like protein (cupin superfamily)